SFHEHCAHPDLHSFPTRRSSDLGSAILVIDDEAAARDLVQRALVKEGYQVQTASSGPEGLALARQLKPAAITLDVMMPGMDGWRSEEHTSELQSPCNLVCRLLLE